MFIHEPCKLRPLALSNKHAVAQEEEIERLDYECEELRKQNNEAHGSIGRRFLGLSGEFVPGLELIGCWRSEFKQHRACLNPRRM